MFKKNAFTLAELLITITVIGIIAALSLPSVISNTQQHEFKTGLRKAVSVLNQAITMNIAENNENAYENADLFNYLQRHMSVMKTTFKLPWWSRYVNPEGEVLYDSELNGAFYTTDGMRFEFDDETNINQNNDKRLPLYESDEHACFASISQREGDVGWTIITKCGGCGSKGLAKNPKKTRKPPCAILVDVNGDRKPTPKKVYESAKYQTDLMYGSEEYKQSHYENYWIPDPKTKRVSDLFVILITEDRAIPYGITAQKAMYGAQR